MLRPPARTTLFPYTTLFRSHVKALVSARDELAYRFTRRIDGGAERQDRKSTRLNSSHMSISYAVFCLKKKMSISSSSRQRLKTHHRYTPQLFTYRVGDGRSP